MPVLRSRPRFRRALRGVVDFQALGERTVYLDCDVLQADGGTRCAAITGAYVAAWRALDRFGLSKALQGSVAAVSVGIRQRRPGLEDAAVHTPAHVLDKRTEQPGRYGCKDGRGINRRGAVEHRRNAATPDRSTGPRVSRRRVRPCPRARRGTTRG